MSFGKMPMANGFLNKKDFHNEFFYNLEVGFSKEHYLFQVNDHPKSPHIFNNRYPFYTNKSKFMVEHFKKYFEWAKKNYLKKDSNVIEVGSNDGSLLKNFKKFKFKHLGFEPSKNIADYSIKNYKVNVFNGFFNTKNVKKFNNFKNNTDLICAANVICHIPDLKNVIKSVDLLLSKKGVFVFEEPYLGSMFKKVSYDQIYDAHVFIFSLHSVRSIFKDFGFDLIDAVKQKTHGGSMRYVIARRGEYKIKNVVIKGLIYEKKYNIDNIKGCLKFKKDCENSKRKLRNIIFSIKKKNKSIAGYAATSKSTTILNYCGIDNRHIDFICDTTKDKIGKFTPKTHIPIVNVDHFRKNLPDFTFLFAWNHKEEIFKKEKEFSQKGKWFAHVEL
jgi:methylation protein EvaC